MNKKIASGLAISLVSLVAVFSFTNPADSSILLLTLPIILIGIIVFCSVSLIARKSFGSDVSPRWSVYLAVALGLTVMMAFVMSSLRQLNVSTFVLLLAFISLFVFYLSKSRK